MKTKKVSRKMAMLTVIACAIVLVSAPAFAAIVLEIHSNTTNGSTTFTDSSANLPEHSITAIDGAKHSTVVTPKFGTSSMSFDGSGAYLSIPDHGDWDFGGGNFTIDMWVRLNDFSNQTFYYHSNTNTDEFNFAFNSTVGLRFQLADATFTVSQGSASGWSLNTWYHIALTRNIDSWKLYRNGGELASGISSDSVADYVEAATVGVRSMFGSPYQPENFFNGYMDDFYIRKGEALNQYQISAISSVGNELREEMIDAFNGGGVDQFSFGYTDQEISQLAEVYAGGTGSGSVTIGDLTWSYLDGTLPGDTGFAIGESYQHDGKWYVKLGSGLEGVPELPAFAPFIALLFGLGMKLKRRKK